MNSYTNPVPAQPRIAFVEANWHHEIVEQGWLGFQAGLEAQGLGEARVERVRVPGALEIPLRCKQLAVGGEYDFLVAAALVVDGGIYRHEFVAQAVISGLMQVQLEQVVPILSLVLTPQHFDDSAERQAFFHEHFRHKGVEVAEALAALQSSQARLCA